jgi:hypothetical protein
MSTGVSTGMSAITDIGTNTDMSSGTSTGMSTVMTVIPDTGTNIGVNLGTVLT